MKAPASLILGLSVISAIAHAQKVIRQVVSSKFGKTVIVRSEFVAKSNAYYELNIVSEPYSLRVLSVAGHELNPRR